jgi:drug/metabolite transporter (DMT)-like permease
VLSARSCRPTPVPAIALAAIPTPLLAALALVVAAAFWGTAFAAAKVVLVEVPPVTVAVLRFAIATVVLIPLACWGGARPVFGLQPALLGLTLATIFFTQNAGLKLTSAAHATLILGGGMPVLIALFGLVWLGERPPRRQVAGLACSLAGIAAVAGVSAQGASTLGGDALVALTAAAGAVFAVLGRRSFAGGNAFAVLAGSTFWGTLLLVPPAAIELSPMDWAWPSAKAVVLLLYLGLCCSALAFALWAYALRHLTAAQNAVVMAVESPIGLAAAALLLGEVLGPIQLLAGALVVAGVGLAIQRPPAALPALPGRAEPPAVSPVGPGRSSLAVPQVARRWGRGPRLESSTRWRPNPWSLRRTWLIAGDRR